MCVFEVHSLSQRLYTGVTLSAAVFNETFDVLSLAFFFSVNCADEFRKEEVNLPKILSFCSLN